MAESWDCISKPLVIRCPIASDGSGSTFGPLVPLTPLWFLCAVLALAILHLHLSFFLVELQEAGHRLVRWTNTSIIIKKDLNIS